MIPFFRQSSVPIDRDRFYPGRPLSRLEVHQQYLHHERQRRLHLASDVDPRSMMRVGSLVVSLRHSFGHVLIGVGRWLANETGANPVLASRR